MKTYQTLLLSTIAVVPLSISHTFAQDQVPARRESIAKAAEENPKLGAAGEKPLPTDPEERFKTLFTNATLSGRWAPLKDGELGEERVGDKYTIVSVVKGTNDNWAVNVKMKYGERELTMPIPVKMRFSGDTAILTVDDLAIPSGGTYTARLLIYERTYSGTWKGRRGGGMLYGTITNNSD